MSIEEIRSFLAARNITIKCVYVQIPNVNPAELLQLRWTVFISKAGDVKMTTPYFKGVAHCEGYKDSPSLGHKINICGCADCLALQRQCCDGYVYKVTWSGAAPHPTLTCTSNEVRVKKVEDPTIDEVFYSLLRDADALHYTFAEWCAAFGSDADSIKAKTSYDACIAAGLGLQRMLTAVELEALNVLFQDY